MIWLAGWVIVFVISWGLGAIVCSYTLWRKNYKATKIAAVILFGTPGLLLILNLFRGQLTEYNYKAAVEEVKVLCEKDGGDKIYKTVDNVQGVFQMRARKPVSYRRADGSFYEAKNDQYGAEDPYGWMQGDYGITGRVGESSIFPNAPPFGKQGYWFIEQQPEYSSPAGSLYRRSYLSPMENPKDWQIRASNGNPLYKDKQINVSTLKSRYGYLSEDLTTKEMRDKWIGAGRIKIIDLQTNEVLAERKGYYRASGDMLSKNAARWANAYECPFKAPHLLHFLHSVLKPVNGFPTNEQLESIAKD